VRKGFLRGAVVRAAARSACGVTGARRYPRGHEALQRLWFQKRFVPLTGVSPFSRIEDCLRGQKIHEKFTGEFLSGRFQASTAADFFDTNY